MGSSTNHFSLFLLLITLSSSLHTYARDSQFFNRASATATVAASDADQPKFLPENDNNYGLYPHDSSQLPKNYNPVAYVTNSFNYLYKPQGMSDTRFLKSGKFFYDLNTHKNSANHPYQILREDPTRNESYNKNFYGNSENAYEFNGEGYQSQDEFEDEVSNLP